MSLKKRILNVLFWSIISAAFIGPGTITTASKAGAEFGFSLLWALVFSTFACLILQEASARIAIHTGRNLGEAIAARFKGGYKQLLILLLVVGAVIIGSAAYETGNFVGAVAGISMLVDIKNYWLVLIMGVMAAIALSIPSLRVLARLMGYLVVIMGAAFLVTAIMIKPDVVEIAKGAFLPAIPDGQGTGLLILGLIGTTVVPYNLFLGSGIADKSQKIKEMRIGLGIAIILGGVISGAVLVVGTAIQGDYSYQLLARALTERMGEWALYLFGFGMFAAGFSSAVTAPLASAITAKSLFGTGTKKKWDIGSRNYRLVWGFVLLTGIFFGVINLKPIPVIIFAQALNGFVLPFISVFLVIVVNDPELMGRSKLNGWVSNIMMGFVVWVTMVLGGMNILKSVQTVTQWNIITHSYSVWILIFITFLFTLGLFYYVFKRRISN
ncbi:MAG: Nramp family divalent metal transporter [Bacteroidetes bacterium]|nr:Nramp family divalent metal transporter [Bacteroidota bacterium]